VSSKFRSYLVILLVVTNLAGGLLAWNAYKEAIRLRATVLRGDNVRADLQKRIWALEKRKNELEAEIAGLRSRGGHNSLANGDDPGTEGQPPGGPGRFDRRARMNNMAGLLENPEFRKLWDSQEKAGLDSRYSALFKALNLSPADLDKFKGLLVERQAAIADVMGAARDQGLDPRNPDDRAQIGALLQNAQAQVDATIQQTLGAAQYAQYQNYEQTLPQRNVVTQLAQSLSYTGSPLQDSQTEALVNILATNTPPQNQNAGGMGGLFAGMGGAGGTFGNRMSPITDSAITQAQSILNATQVVALQQLQTQQQAQRQIAQMLRQPAASGSASSSGGSSPTQTSHN
jgi:hypothetical protein